ncbi:MAG TPA: helix-turn-helix transcriptional regulator [Methylomirabilota bacterium]|jgi:transcriptional regulator with XRE-family HTH domain|nr:helix-turn-helix transcriptional regulator [Methylomirabilota bacterium]
MKPLSKVDLVELLRQRAKRAGSQQALAETLGVTPAYLSDVLAGRREPGPKILEALRLRRQVVYVRRGGG